MKNNIPQILLVDDDEQLRELIKASIESAYEVKVQEANGGHEAINYIQESNSSFALIISDYAMPKGNGNLILNWLDKENIKIPFIFFTSYFSNQITKSDLERSFALVTKPSLDGSLLKYIGSALKQMKILNLREGYVRIKVDWILDLPRALADYYTKEINNNFKLLLKRGTPLDTSETNKLSKDNLKQIWVKAEEGAPLISAIIQRLELEIKSQKEDWSSTIDWHNKISEVTHSFHKAMGWTQQVEELATKNLQLVEKKMQEIPQLRELFDKIKNNNGHYLYKHCSALTYVCIGLIQQFNLIEEDHDNVYECLAAAAIIHDITLTEDAAEKRDLYRQWISENTENNEDSFTLYKEHPELAAHIVRSWSSVHEDVEAIVMHHHERPDGSGFPFKLHSEEFSTLSCIFNFSHDLTEYCLTQGSEINFKDFCDKRKNLYTTGLFRDMLNKIESSVSH
ncbi:MAG: response regulator [Bdellovibrionales bacterium]|nr:response regulator [Bdellovibrionales bacterium]